MMPALPTRPEGSAPIDPQARAGALPQADAGSAEPIGPRMRVVAPNANAGQAYCEAIAAHDADGVKLTVTQVALGAPLGLCFDAAAQVLRGTPLQAGEYPAHVVAQDAQGCAHTGTLVLIVNANPRDLWRCLESDPSAPHPKPNAAVGRLDAGRHRLLAASQRGRSHAHGGAFRDDDVWIAHDAASGWNVLIVTDGAGSARYSRRGAALAAQHMGQHLLSQGFADLDAAVQTWCQAPGQSSHPLHLLLYPHFGNAAWSALHAIEAQAQADAADPKDYATTVHCALHCPTPEGAFVASFGIGDGLVCAYTPGDQPRLMGRPDTGAFAGQTQFLDRTILGDAQAVWARIDIAHVGHSSALILMTDGIGDPFFESPQAHSDGLQWQRLWAELAPALASQEPASALLQWMDFFKPGYHDDRTLALCIAAADLP
jgi:hypothetical protein